MCDFGIIHYSRIKPGRFCIKCSADCAPVLLRICSDQGRHQLQEDQKKRFRVFVCSLVAFRSETDRSKKRYCRFCIAFVVVLYRLMQARPHCFLYSRCTAVVFIVRTNTLFYNLENRGDATRSAFIITGSRYGCSLCFLWPDKSDSSFLGGGYGGMLFRACKNCKIE